MKIKSDFYESVRRLALSDWTYDKEIKTHSTSIKTTKEQKKREARNRPVEKWSSDFPLWLKTILVKKKSSQKAMVKQLHYLIIF